MLWTKKLMILKTDSMNSSDVGEDTDVTEKKIATAEESALLLAAVERVEAPKNGGAVEAEAVPEVRARRTLGVVVNEAKALEVKVPMIPGVVEAEATAPVVEVGPMIEISVDEALVEEAIVITARIVDQVWQTQTMTVVQIIAKTQIDHLLQ
jgi:hypothetical protein